MFVFCDDNRISYQMVKILMPAAVPMFIVRKRVRGSLGTYFRY